MTLPRFLVVPEALASVHTVLTGPDLHHLRVRRLRAGSEVILADGLGRQRQGVVVSVDRRQAVIRLTNALPVQRESTLHLVLAQALLKRDKLDLVIEKATELGTTEIVVFTSERSVLQADGDRRARWGRVARSAAQQCQRSTLPRIAGPLSFDDLLSSCADGLRLLFWEEQVPGSLAHVHRQHAGAVSILAVVGPEGGFSTAEAARAAAAGFHLVGLAPRILRAETAALAAVTLCQFLWGDLGRGDG